MKIRSLLMIGGCILFGGVVLFGVLELRDWKAKKEIERAVAEAQETMRQRSTGLRRTSIRQGAATSLIITLEDMIDTRSTRKLRDKLMAALEGDESDPKIEQLIEAASRIGPENPGLEGAAYWKKHQLLIKEYYP